VSGRGSRDDDTDVHLGWKDFLALFIAFVETLALPLVVLIVVLFVLLILIGVLR
jgi:hypothetical protein